MRLLVEVVEGTIGAAPSPSPHNVKPKKSWSEAGLLLVTLVFTLNVYFVFIRRKLQPIKAKGQWLTTLTVLGAYLLLMWTSFAVTFGASDLVCQTGFHLVLSTYALQTGPCILRHVRNLGVYSKARRITASGDGLLEKFLGSGQEVSTRESFPKTFSLIRQSSLVTWLVLAVLVLAGVQYQLLDAFHRGVMVEPAVQCLSEEALRSQATTQTSFWFSVHLAEAVLYVWTFLHDVPSKYFPELLEDKAELAAFFALSACQCALYLRFHELGPLSDLLGLSGQDLAALLMYLRCSLHYLIHGLLPLVRSFGKNFQASVDSYVADAMDCKQKGRVIAGRGAAPALGGDGDGAGGVLHNRKDKIKYLLKDILGLDAFQRFLEGHGLGREEGLNCLLKWYQIETICINLEEIPGQRNEGKDPNGWHPNFNRLTSQMQRIYAKLEQWDLSQIFDEAVDGTASLFLSEAMESDSAHRLPNKIFLNPDQGLSDQLIKSPIKRILLSRKLLGQFVSQHYECLRDALGQSQTTLLRKLQDHYEGFLESEEKELLISGWLVKHVIACLLIRIRVMNVPSEDSYLDLITKESLQFVVLQSLGFSS